MNSNKEKGVPTALTWYIKTRVLGILALFVWVIIFIISFIFLGSFFNIQNTALKIIISIIIPSVIIVPMVIGYNKKYVGEWKASKSKENLQKSKTIATIFMIIIGLLILFVFVGPLFFGIEILDQVKDSPIIPIIFVILILAYVYCRFIKKER